MATQPTARRRDFASGQLQIVAAIASLVLIFAAVVIGIRLVGGIYDSESFTCGSAFFGTTDDLGYGGTEQYAACLRERGHLGKIGLGSLVVGVALLGAVVASARTRKRRGAGV